MQNATERVQAAQAARDLAQQQLDAENNKFAVGMSTNFQIVQAQRDLATAQNNELSGDSRLQESAGGVRSGAADRQRRDDHASSADEIPQRLRRSRRCIAAGHRCGRPAVEPPPIRLDAIITDRKASSHPRSQAHPISKSAMPASPGRWTRSRCSPARTARLVAIFLDEYHVQAGDHTERARAALATVRRHGAAAQDLVAIMKPLDPLNAIQTAHASVEDRAKLQAQIEAFSGRKGDYTPTTAFERNFMSRASGPADASARRSCHRRCSRWRSGLAAPRGPQDQSCWSAKDSPPSLPRGSDRLMGSVRAIVYAANRYEVAIYPVDPASRPPLRDTAEARRSHPADCWPIRRAARRRSISLT